MHPKLSSTMGRGKLPAPAGAEEEEEEHAAAKVSTASQVQRLLQVLPRHLVR